MRNKVHPRSNMMHRTRLFNRSYALCAMAAWDELASLTKQLTASCEEMTRGTRTRQLAPAELCAKTKACAAALQER